MRVDILAVQEVLGRSCAGRMEVSQSNGTYRADRGTNPNGRDPQTFLVDGALGKATGRACPITNLLVHAGCSMFNEGPKGPQLFDVV
jgi:hypothetical protein